MISPTKVGAHFLRHQLRTEVRSMVYFCLRHQLRDEARSMGRLGAFRTLSVVVYKEVNPDEGGGR